MGWNKLCDNDWFKAVEGLKYLALAEDAQELTYPKHQRCRADDDDPVGDAQRGDVEELATEADNQDLPEQYCDSNREEATAVFEMEGGATGLEGSGIEKVPELEEHKEGEEHRELIGVERWGANSLRSESKQLGH